MKHKSLLAILVAPLMIATSCSGQPEAKFPDFSAESQDTAMKIHTKFVADCGALVEKNLENAESIWNVSSDEADAFCDCTATKVVSNFSEDGLQKVLSDIKRARGIPMLPMAVFARFGDDAKTTVEACK